MVNRHNIHVMFPNFVVFERNCWHNGNPVSQPDIKVNVSVRQRLKTTCLSGLSPFNVLQYCSLIFSLPLALANRPTTPGLFLKPSPDRSLYRETSMNQCQPWSTWWCSDCLRWIKKPQAAVCVCVSVKQKEIETEAIELVDWMGAKIVDWKSSFLSAA